MTATTGHRPDCPQHPLHSPQTGTVGLDSCICHLPTPDFSRHQEEKIEGTKDSVCNDCFDDGFKGAPCPHIKVTPTPSLEWERELETQLSEYAEYTAWGDSIYPLKKALKNLFSSTLSQERKLWKERLSYETKEAYAQGANEGVALYRKRIEGEIEKIDMAITTTGGFRREVLRIVRGDQSR